MNSILYIVGILLLLIMPNTIGQVEHQREQVDVISIPLNRCSPAPIGISPNDWSKYKWWIPNWQSTEPELMSGWSVFAENEYYKRYGVGYGEWPISS